LHSRIDACTGACVHAGAGAGSDGVRVASGIIDHALEIDDNGGLIADHPGVVTARQERDVAGPAIEFRAVVHADAQHASDVILEMRCLAACGLGNWLDRGRPTPTWFEDSAANYGAADLDQFQTALGKLAHFLRRAEALELGFCLCCDGWLGNG
jgi:hypothetical protein